MPNADAIAQGQLDARSFLCRYGVRARDEVRPEAWAYDNSMRCVDPVLA